MARPSKSRLGQALSPPHGKPSRESGEGRLDPVRRRRPARGTLFRLAAVAALLILAALVSWSPPPTCEPSTGSVVVFPSASNGSRLDGGSTPTGDSAATSGDSAPARTGNSAAAPGNSTTTQAGNSSATSDSTAASPEGSGTGPPGSTAVPSGTVGVPIRLADPTALSLVKPGNRVDLLRVDAKGTATAVAAAALVLTVTGASDPTTGGLLLALSPSEAKHAVATPNNGFAVLIRPG